MVVLVVEDSPTMRQLVCYALRKIEGIVLVEATDGKNALEKLTEIRPDVILTDLNMPLMDGFALIEAVRQRPELAQIPVVVLTTEGALIDQQRAGALGVAAYVTKPIKHGDVVEAVLRVAGKT